MNFIKFWLLDDWHQIVDNFNFRVIYIFDRFMRFFQERPEDVKQIGLGNSISNGQSSYSFIKILDQNHEEVDDIFMCTSMSIGLFCQIDQEGNQEIITHFE